VTKFLWIATNYSGLS